MRRLTWYERMILESTDTTLEEILAERTNDVVLGDDDADDDDDEYTD